MAEQASFRHEFASPTRQEKPPSVKFSTSGGETARSGVSLQPPAGGAAAPPAASRGRRPRGHELRGVGVGSEGAGWPEWQGQGSARPGVCAGPRLWALERPEQETCAILWLSVRGEGKRAEAEREWNERGGRAKSHPGLGSRPVARPGMLGGHCAGSRGGLRCGSEPPEEARGLCSPREPGEARRRSGVSERTR